MSADPIVRIEHVTKTFGAVTAIDDLDMEIRAGEFVTFLGPSGCGKSTTLRVLGGFDRPDRGRIVLDGEDVTALPPNRRKVNMVFQDYALFPHMSVRRNIAFGLELKGLSRDAIDARIAELAAFLELRPQLDRRPDQLSGGQRQRVALARALAPDPALLLLDEPLGALDAKLRAQVQAELKTIQRRTGKTFFFVTHDQDEALTMSDRIVVMNRGRVEQDGTPEELYLHPASRFVAEFVGETNLIEARISGLDGARARLDWHGLALLGQVGGARPRRGRPGARLAAARERQGRRRAPRDGQRGRGRGHGTHLPGQPGGPRRGGPRRARRTDCAPTSTRPTARSVPDGPVWLGWEASDLAILRD